MLGRIGLETFVAFVSAGVVTPIVATVDVAVVENAAGKNTLRQSILRSIKSIFGSPGVYLRSFEFRWISGIYLSTYAANNLVEYFCGLRGSSTVVPKLVFVTLANMLTTMLKDAAFAPRFGGKAGESVGLPTHFVWTVRNVLTMAAAFELPVLIARKLRSLGLSSGFSTNFSQFLAPVLAQLILTPIHLLGLDLFNFPKDAWALRALRIQKLYVFNTLVRMVRMGGAYGIGGVTNNYLRKTLIENVHINSK